MNGVAEILEKSTTKELNGIKKIIDAESNSKIDIISSLRNKSKNTKETLFGRGTKIRGGGDIGIPVPDRISYKEVLERVGNKLGIRRANFLNKNQLEKEITEKVLEGLEDELNEEEIKKLDDRIKQGFLDEYEGVDEKKVVGVYGVVAGTVQLSGFTAYLASSTALSAITSGAGVTLPFTAYTLASSAISTVVGPAGWVGASLYALWGITSPDYKKLIPAVLYISALRGKYEATEM
ncbi:hypothetical protein [Salinibacter ruber]|uniref:hypothetical protein n=1 Tax=Salinibacter ruber TaxID=146919 RepID=UPI00160964FC|nr:hypothetical protein [Salinibacter ruber]MBB4062516.1 uncharacterized protein YaaW (UPF0174 family) [Salinibacter ruber]MCS3705013.1 uncharacterized protein YaaW (UPF0174 family) [Salinibacter ruber]